MSNPLYLDSWYRDIYVVEIGIPGPPGSGFTPSEAVQVRNDLDELLGRPEIDTLESLTNVPDTGAVNGQTVVKSTGGWVYGNPNSSLSSVSDTWSEEADVENVTIITTGPGIKVEELSSGSGVRAHMGLQFGSAGAFNGTSTEAARRDHSHTRTVQQETKLNYQGVLSTGSRIISPTSFGVTGLDPDIIYDIEVTAVFDVIDAGLNSIVTPRISIGGGSFNGYDVQFKGHGKNVTIKNVATGVTGVSSYPVVARVFYKSGPQIEIGEGQIVVIAKPRR